MKGRDKRRKAKRLRDRAEVGNQTKDASVTEAAADLPLNSRDPEIRFSMERRDVVVHPVNRLTRAGDHDTI